jgi:hypothetical protein
LTFVLPPGPGEGVAVDVLVFSRNGVASAPEAITYNLLPLATGFSGDTSGIPSGGASLTITGRGFQGADDVALTLGSAVVEDVQVISDTELQITVPPKASDDEAFTKLAVTVTTANGSATLPDVFMYTAHGFLGVSRRNQNASVVYIDPVSFELREIRRLPQPVPSMFLNGDGTLIALSGRCCTKSFGEFNPLTGVQSPIATVTPGIPSEMTVAGSTYVAIGRRDNTVYQINPTTGAAAAIGPGLGSPNGLAALAPRDAGSVFAVASMNSELRVINATTGAITLGAVLDGPVGLVPHAALRLDEDSLLVAAHAQNNSSQLFKVTIATGAVELLKVLDKNLTSLVQTPASFE